MTDHAPDTIVLIHGLWMTPRSWEGWADRYAAAGYRVLTPAYPGMDLDIETLRDDPSPIARLDISTVADHMAEVVAKLDTAPIIMGHSFGGLLTQLLLDRGLGAAGVAIHGAGTRGVTALRPSQVIAGWPVLRNPANARRAVALTPREFRYSFANTQSVQDARAAYDRYAVPASGRIFFELALANVQRDTAARVDYGREGRAPLLHIAGSKDHIVPAPIQRQNYRKYAKRSTSINAFKEFPGRTHFTCGAPGWEDVADYALRWARTPVDGVNPYST